jgi:hypothetical protein
MPDGAKPRDKGQYEPEEDRMDVRRGEEILDSKSPGASGS